MRDKFIKIVCSSIFFVIVSAFIAEAQVLSGAAYLKTLPGARMQALSGSATASLGDIHAQYANPGTIAFLREWQWAASYTKWIADVYNASFLYGMRIRTPWSPHTRFTAGILYQGMPEFDSTDGAKPAETANDAVVSVGMGQPLPFIHKNFSVGLNLKYLHSKLAQYNASSIMFDAGVAYRTRRFELKQAGFGFMRWGFFAFGASITNIGQDLTYISIATPLPQTLRTGLAFYAGSHYGMQMQVSADYIKIKDHDGRIGFGGELTWNRLFSLCAGYDYDADLMSRTSFGMSLQLDDVYMPDDSPIPGRNKSMRIDVASVDEDEFFSRTYRGTLSHFPIGPEGFRFKKPAMHEKVKADSIYLNWESTRDPDFYDDVRLLLVINTDSSKLANVLTTMLESRQDIFQPQLHEGLFLAQEVFDNKFILRNLNGGDYYWAVIAADRDFHLRFANTGKHIISHFAVPYPDLLVENLKFEYDPWITTDDFQGYISFDVVNRGESPAWNVPVSLLDSTSKKLLVEKAYEKLEINKPETIKIPWHTTLAGAHSVWAMVDAGNTIRELLKDNNVHEENFYTIPKGTFSTADTSKILLVAQVNLELPVINEVCMDVNSTKVDSNYLHRYVYDPPLGVFAERLKEFPHLRLKLKGYADSNTDSATVELAEARAKAVRDSLIDLGVAGNQIKFEDGEVLPERRVPANPVDAKRVFHERRYVKVDAEGTATYSLFAPVLHQDFEDVKLPVVFQSDIKGVVPITECVLGVYNDLYAESVDILPFADGKGSVIDSVMWHPFKNPERIIEDWVKKELSYTILLKDNMGRIFKTHENNSFLIEFLFLREHRICFPLKFANTDPLYDFYWARIYSMANSMFNENNMRMRFEGHACAIGPEEVNDRLSKRRAKSFYNGFVKYVQARNPEDFEMFVSRMDEPKGYGESLPLQIVRLNGDVILIGDNNDPVGRKFNRRIEIVFYSTEKFVIK